MSAKWSVTTAKWSMTTWIGAGVNETDLRGRVGFCVMLFTWEPGFLTHVSNGERADVARMLREYADVMERRAESPPIADLDS